MSRINYVVVGLAALIFAVVVAATVPYKQLATSVASQPVAASPAGASASDSTLVAIDDLAAWPAAAGR